MAVLECVLSYFLMNSLALSSTLSDDLAMASLISFRWRLNIRSRALQARLSFLLGGPGFFLLLGATTSSMFSSPSPGSAMRSRPPSDDARNAHTRPYGCQSAGCQAPAGAPTTRAHCPMSARAPCGVRRHGGADGCPDLARNGCAGPTASPGHRLRPAMRDARLSSRPTMRDARLSSRL